MICPPGKSIILYLQKGNRKKIELVTRPVTTDNSNTGQVSTAGSPLTDMSKLLLTQAPVVAPHLVAQNSSLPNLSSTASVQPSLTTSRITATSSPGIANMYIKFDIFLFPLHCHSTWFISQLPFTLDEGVLKCIIITKKDD